MGIDQNDWEKTLSLYLFLVRRARPRHARRAVGPARVQDLDQGRGDGDAGRDWHDDVEDLAADGVDDRFIDVIVARALSSISSSSRGEQRKIVPRRGAVERGATHGEEESDGGREGTSGTRSRTSREEKIEI